MLLDNAGGEAPSEWDEEGFPIRYMTVIGLKRKDMSDKLKKGKGATPKAGAATRASHDSSITKNSKAADGAATDGKGNKNSKKGNVHDLPDSPYEVKKLGLQKFHHVLHYMY